MDGLKLIVGLGNVGEQYAKTRHNVGFWWLSALAQQRGCVFRQNSKFFGEMAQLDGVMLLKPHTMMNNSGRAIASVVRYYALPAEAILLVHDDLDLAAGKVKLKQGGGHGGHNGLKDTLLALDAAVFWRLKLGIGHPGVREQVVPYVLSAPSTQEREQIEQAMTRSLAIFDVLRGGDFQRAMLTLHSSEL